MHTQPPTQPQQPPVSHSKRFLSVLITFACMGVNRMHRCSKHRCKHTARQHKYTYLRYCVIASEIHSCIAYRSHVSETRHWPENGKGTVENSECCHCCAGWVCMRKFREQPQWQWRCKERQAVCLFSTHNIHTHNMWMRGFAKSTHSTQRKSCPWDTFSKVSHPFAHMHTRITTASLCVWYWARSGVLHAIKTSHWVNGRRKWLTIQQLIL